MMGNSATQPLYESTRILGDSVKFLLIFRQTSNFLRIKETGAVHEKARCADLNTPGFALRAGRKESYRSEELYKKL